MHDQRPPQIAVDFANLPDNPKQRHEALVNIFGAYLFWLRNLAVDTTHQLVESDESRAKLGNLKRRPYEATAALDSEGRVIACQLADVTVNRFIQLLLTMLSGTGSDQRLGVEHAIRFELNMEILRVDDGVVVDRETINRDGEKFFADYWGRWLNQFGGNRSHLGQE